MSMNEIEQKKMLAFWGQLETITGFGQAQFSQVQQEVAAMAQSAKRLSIAMDKINTSLLGAQVHAAQVVDLFHVSKENPVGEDD